MSTKFENHEHNDPNKITAERKQAIKAKYKEQLERAKTDEYGCMIAPSKNSSGYADVKIGSLVGTGNAKKAKDAKPPKKKQDRVRTYKIPYLYDKDEGLPAGKDCSHLCGRGDKGCMNPQHIVLESRKANLARQGHPCGLKCKCGELVFPECKCNPKCIQKHGAEAFN